MHLNGAPLCPPTRTYRSHKESSRWRCNSSAPLKPVFRAEGLRAGGIERSAVQSPACAIPKTPRKQSSRTMRTGVPNSHPNSIESRVKVGPSGRLPGSFGIARLRACTGVCAAICRCFARGRSTLRGADGRVTQRRFRARTFVSYGIRVWGWSARRSGAAAVMPTSGTCSPTVRRRQGFAIASTQERSASS